MWRWARCQPVYSYLYITSTPNMCCCYCDFVLLYEFNLIIINNNLDNSLIRWNWFSSFLKEPGFGFCSLSFSSPVQQAAADQLMAAGRAFKWNTLIWCSVHEQTAVYSCSLYACRRENHIQTWTSWRSSFFTDTVQPIRRLVSSSLEVQAAAFESCCGEGWTWWTRFSAVSCRSAVIISSKCSWSVQGAVRGGDKTFPAQHFHTSGSNTVGSSYFDLQVAADHTPAEWCIHTVALFLKKQNVAVSSAEGVAFTVTGKCSFSSYFSQL